MMKEIKSINKKSLANITALIYGLVGFFMALLVTFITIGNIIFRNNFQGSVTLVSFFNLGQGLILGVLTSLLNSFLGYAVGYLTALIYNCFQKKVGGIKVELADVAEEKPGEKK